MACSGPLHGGAAPLTAARESIVPMCHLDSRVAVRTPRDLPGAARASYMQLRAAAAGAVAALGAMVVQQEPPGGSFGSVASSHGGKRANRTDVPCGLAGGCTHTTRYA